MLYAFVDESERGDSHYFLGALICTFDQAARLGHELDGVLERYGQTHPMISVSSELHGHAMMQGRDHWKAVPLKMRADVYLRALERIAASGGAYYLEAIDIEKHRQRYVWPYPPREVVFSYLLERINEYALRHLTPVTIIADDHHTEVDSRANFYLS